MKKIFALFGLVLTVFSTSVLATVETEKKYDHVDLVMILDKSGSMHGMESDTIGGFNSMLDKQRKVDVKTDVTTVMFNNNSNYIHERKPLSEIRNLTNEDYMPQGTTALLDSVGMTIDKVNGYYGVNDKKNKVIFADIIINGVTIYGCRIVDGKKGEFVAFPSQKSEKDGKYYNHAWFDLTEEESELIIDEAHKLAD